MGLLIENFKMAVSSILANKMRSFLTMLGIIIGISSVITITSVGASVTKSMNSFLSSFGKNRIIIILDYKEDSIPSESHRFNNDDIDYLKEKLSDSIAYISPFVSETKDIKNGYNSQKTSMLGVDYNYIPEASSNKIIYGRDFFQTDITGRKNVAIVDVEFAKKMYGIENVVGKEISTDLGGIPKSITIIGVYKKEKSIFDKLQGNQPPETFVPYTIIPYGSNYFLDMKISEDKDLKQEIKRVQKFITRYKRVPEDTYKVESLEEQSEMINNILNMLSLGLGAIAAISLVVGGIGIMNIMLVSVTERTKEIGVRKSLGARKKDILLQFMIESMILSVLGGIMGTILGLILSNVFAKFMNTPTTLEIKSIIIAIVFSLGVGMFFGLYPANKAAKLDPIDALRYE